MVLEALCNIGFQLAEVSEVVGTDHCQNARKSSSRPSTGSGELPDCRGIGSSRIKNGGCGGHHSSDLRTMACRAYGVAGRGLETLSNVPEGCWEIAPGKRN
jgi:hypothetical protein